ncbi:MAG: PAS domain-containing protein [Desulfobulbaceae bacterium]|nr:PAS domain-containing protein [Desulfobulbaceae bacterium]
MQPFFLALMLIVCLAGAAHLPIPAHGAEPIKIGIMAYPSKAQVLAQWQPLTVILKQAMPERDFVVLALTPAELDKAVAARQLDFVLTNSGHYVLLRNHGALSSPLATLATDVAGQSVTVYGGVIFSRAGHADINSLLDIKGKTVAAVDIRSQGGYQTQAYELSRVGVRMPQDVKLITTGLPMDQVVAAVLAGRAEVGFVRSGLLEGMVREGKLDIKQLKILNRQDRPDFPLQVSTRLYPEWPFAALPHVDADLARHVVATLFMLDENTAVMRATGIHGFVVPVDYSSVEEVMRELRMPPFDVTPRFTLQDVWTRYRWQTLGGSLAGGVILLLGVSILLMYRRLAANHRVLLQQRQKLQENEEKFRTVADYTYGWEIWEDQVGTCQYCSPACERVTGYAPEAFMADPGLLARLIHPDDLPKWQAHYAVMHNDTKRREIPREETNELVFRILRADGEICWIGHLCHYICDAEGNDLGLRISNRDITERKRVEEMLRNSEKELRTLAEAMPQIVWITRPDGWFIYFNQQWVDYTGLTLEESYGHGWNKPFHPDDQQRAWEAWQNAVNNFTEYSLECRLRRADGIYKWWLIRGVPLQDSDGTILKWFGTCTDINELKRTEDALRLKERLLAESQRLGHVGSFLYDMTDPIQWSDELYHLYGVSPDTFTPTVESFSGLIHPDDRTSMQDWIGACVAGEKPAALDFRLNMPDGTLRFIRGEGEAVFDEQNRFLYLAGTGQDITERKHAEEALQRYSAELEKKNQELLEALAKVKQLTGMLPICASCKKIRDDNGHWNGVESYVSKHSEAVFSHGLCPDCEKEAYADLDSLKKETNYNGYPGE